MPNVLSQLTKGEQTRLFEELNYMNLEEIRRSAQHAGSRTKSWPVPERDGEGHARQPIESRSCWAVSAATSRPARWVRPRSSPPRSSALHIGSRPAQSVALGGRHRTMRLDLVFASDIPRRPTACACATPCRRGGTEHKGCHNKRPQRYTPGSGTPYQTGIAAGLSTT